MSTKYIYANNITQTNTSQYRTFKDTNKLKGTSGYAVSNGLIHGKNSTPNRPSTLTFKNFKAGLPTGAEVSKVTVEYKHSKVAYNGKYLNVTAPTITLLGVSGKSGKGAAPPKTASAYSKSFKFSKPLSSTTVNSSDFGVKLDYPKNANSYEGYIRVYYVRLKVEYTVPSYNLKVSLASVNYNKYSHIVKFDLSNVNGTGYEPTIVITAPVGFTFKESIVANSQVKDYGTVTQTQSRVFTWKPGKMKGYSSKSVGLVFDVDVSGSLPASVSFSAVEQLTSKTGSLSYSVVEAPVEPELDTGETDTSFTDDTDVADLTVKNVTVDEEFDYTFKIDDTTWDSIIRTIFNYGVSQGWWLVFSTSVRQEIISNSLLFLGHPELTPVPGGGYSWSGDLSENSKISRYDSSSWLTDCYPKAFSVIDAMTTKEIPLNLKGTSSGTDTIPTYAAYAPNNNNSYLVALDYESIFDIRPLESSLSEPFLTRLTPTTEETHRLGNGYNYTVQTYLKETTNDTYVRDWYKNFRIGVFNNPITSNVTSYMNWETTETTQDQTLYIDSMLDLTGATLTLAVDKAISVTIGETTYTLADNGSQNLTSLTDYNIPVTLAKVTQDTVNLTTTLKDSNNTTLEVRHYIIKFEQTETKEPYETTTDTTDYDDLTDSQIYSNAEYWGNTVTTVNEYQSINTEFTYNENYPLYILVTGDYPEGNPTNTSVKFTEPVIIESTHYEGWEQNGNYPNPIDDIILNDGSTSEWSYGIYENGSGIILYDLPLEEEFGTGTDLAIRGIEVTGNIEQTTRLTVYATLTNPDGQTGTRSIIIDDTDTELHIGGLGDLWNFTTLDLTKLEDWQITLETSNTLTETEGNLNIGDLQVIFYIEQIETQEINCYVEGEDLRYYGAFLENVKIPEGLETDTQYLSIDGTDTNDVYRQNIREKTIEIDFTLDQCDLTTATTMLRQLTQLLTNKRDKYNRPIPKRIEFTHYPDVYFEYIMQEPLDNNIDISNYTVKAKLVIPSGTAYKKENTVTATNGYVQGLASINPVITIKPNGAEIEILETISNQKFNINYPGDTTDKLIEIDTEDRIAWLKTSEDDKDPVNISSYVDFNSDWFKLQGEYKFEATNAIIRTIDYTERW